MAGATKGRRLNDALTNALDKRKAQGTIRNLSIQPPGSVDFSSSDFLSLATSQELREAYLEELRTGPSTVHLGSGGSRLLDGNSSYAEELENDIAAFHRAEKGLLCNSGFDANAALFSCLPQPGDAIVYDEFIHASVHDGMRLSRAGQKLAFAHNSAAALNATLVQLLCSDGEIKSGRRNVFIAVEAVYSMDGDVAPLKEMVRVVHEMLPLGNGHLIVDEAHSNGVLGLQGRGLVCQLGLEKEVSVRLHTFGKALACNGGMGIYRLKANQEVPRADNNNSSHSFMFSADTPIPHQLRSASHIHDIHVLPRSRRHQSFVQIPPVREDRSRKRAGISQTSITP